MKTVFACSAALVVAFMATPALAQSNPFMPPQAGMTREQIQAIVRKEIDDARKLQPTTPTKGPPVIGPDGKAIKSAVDNTRPQGAGVPVANTAAGGTPGAPAAPVSDPVADLLKEGGSFVGCVGGTPVFKDKIGRRAYFTSKELRESNEARRFARCG